jgi:hypothetical protein
LHQPCLFANCWFDTPRFTCSRKPNAEISADKPATKAKAAKKPSVGKFGDGSGAFSFKKKTTDNPE